VQVFRSHVRRAAIGVLCAATLVGFHSSVAGAQALPDAKTLMEKHNSAIGGRAALEKYSSMRIAGTISIPAQGISGTLEIFRAKPNKFVQKLMIPQVGEILQGYDGKVAWATNPMQGPTILQAEMAEGLKSQAEFASNFQNPADYSRAETVELVDFEGRKCYKVKVTRGTRDGVEYFDVMTGMLAGIGGSLPTPQGPIERSTVFREYGDFGGVKFPTRVEQRDGPSVTTITFATVEFDRLSPNAFDLPVAVKALVKP
jgi:zinc protease